MEDYKTDEELYILPCHHLIHTGCLEDLSRHDNRCPMCRESFYTRHVCSFCEEEFQHGDDMFELTSFDIGLPETLFHAECAAEEFDEMINMIGQ